MTATRGIAATLFVVTLVAVGGYFWMQNGSGCPADFSAANTYRTDDEVRFAGQVWRTSVEGSTQVPGPNATDWTAAGTC